MGVSSKNLPDYMYMSQRIRKKIIGCQRIVLSQDIKYQHINVTHLSGLQVTQQYLLNAICMPRPLQDLGNLAMNKEMLEAWLFQSLGFVGWDHNYPGRRVGCSEDEKKQVDAVAFSRVAQECLCDEDNQGKS